ncbi:MAG: protein kinase [Proteobacteria bacterium]|nr:protein kinase [Pseudomonadota bacterium]
MDNPLVTHNLAVPGSTIVDRYEVVRSLGMGGMGSVVQVIDKQLDNEVLAIKILFPHLAKDTKNFARFRNEVILARRLSHPNLIKIFDFGQTDKGYFFITMEYASGGNITDQIYKYKREALNLFETVRILRDIACGIHHAHQHGVVHRDLKPDNILLGDKREVKIADFGLARSMELDKGFTTTGETVGTPYYMAPEQLSGDKVDGRVDIYSLGIIAYEMMMGRRMFYDDNYLQLAQKHFTEPVPDFANKETGIPKWFEDFVKKCSAKKKEKRFQSAGEIVAFLSDKLTDIDVDHESRHMPAIFSLYSAPKRKKSNFKKYLQKSLSILFIVGLIGVVGYLINSSTFLKARLSGLSKIFEPTVKIDFAKIKEEIAKGNKEVVETVLGAGYDIDSLDEAGESMLLIALRLNQVETAKYLIENNANVNISSNNKITPLMYAAKNPDVSVFYELIKKGANTDVRDVNLKTPLMYAIEAKNTVVVQAIVDKGTILSSRDKDGATALMYAVKSDELENVQILLRKKVDLNMVDEAGKSALFYAVESKEDQITDALINAGADVNITDKSGKTPVQYASTKNRKLIKSTYLR